MREDDSQGGFSRFGPVGAAGPEDKGQLQGGGSIIAGPRQCRPEAVPLRLLRGQKSCGGAGEILVERGERKAHVGAAFGRRGVLCLLQDHHQDPEGDRLEKPPLP